MSSRKFGYVFSVILLAILFSAIDVFVGFAIGKRIVENRMLIPLPGLGWVAHGGSPISMAPFWKDGFVTLDMDQFHPNGDIEWRAHSIDPETGAVTDLNLTLREPNRLRFSPNVFGDKLFFTAFMGADKSFEVVDGIVKPSALKSIPRSLDGASFLWNNELAVIESTKTAIVVHTFKVDRWQLAGEIVLPEPIPNTGLLRGLLQCFNQDDRLHLFLNLDGYLYYREGIELKAGSPSADAEPAQTDAQQDLPTGSTREAEPTAAATERAGWTLVRSRDLPIAWSRFFYHSQSFMGMLIDESPAAMIVDDMPSGSAVGHVYRFDGTSWTEFASQTFPFGSIMIRAVPRLDRQCSYVIATTSTGSTFVYAVDANGFRITKASVPTPIHTMRSIGALLWYPSGVFVWATLLGTSAWALMWWWTKPEYEFGVQTVKLASLGWRGLARLIDILFIGASTATLVWLMMRDFDWLTPLEAYNLEIDHPTIHTVARICGIAGVWIVGVVISLIVTQAVWGITPGKWLCGLRTMRTSLRPCGFASSLAREIVFFVDSCNLICFAPGIVSIALTDHRQRLGDLVADTIVVNANSI